MVTPLTVVALTVVALMLGELTDVLAEKLPDPSIVAAVTNATPAVVLAVPVPFFNRIGLAVVSVYPLCVVALSILSTYAPFHHQ